MKILTSTEYTARDKTMQLANDVDPQVLDLAQVERIELHFPKFTDGRAYSQAYLLRRRLSFQGELVATGEVLVDQLALMQRAGFDLAVLRADQPPRLGTAGLRCPPGLCRRRLPRRCTHPAAAICTRCCMRATHGRNRALRAALAAATGQAGASRAPDPAGRTAPVAAQPGQPSATQGHHALTGVCRPAAPASPIPSLWWTWFCRSPSRCACMPNRAVWAR